MRTLWRSSISILRQYPILWLPVLLAEFINFNLGWFTNSCRHWLIQRILPWLSEGHSVLSNGPVYGGLSQQVINKAILLASPLEWVSRFLLGLDARVRAGRDCGNPIQHRPERPRNPA